MRWIAEPLHDLEEHRNPRHSMNCVRIDPRLSTVGEGNRNVRPGKVGSVLEYRTIGAQSFDVGSSRYHEGEREGANAHGPSVSMGRQARPHSWEPVRDRHEKQEADHVEIATPGWTVAAIEPRGPLQPARTSPEGQASIPRRGRVDALRSPPTRSRS